MDFPILQHQLGGVCGLRLVLIRVLQTWMGHKSQCGYVIGLASKEIAEGQEAPILLLEANSSSIKRVCRSTLAAESNAFLMAYEAADYVGSLVRELLHPGVSLRNLEKEYARVPVYAFTDAKSLGSTINKDAGQPSDKRVKILVAQIKESFWRMERTR